MSLVISCSSKKGMAIIERIGIPQLQMIRESAELGNNCFSTSTCFVLKAGLFGDVNASDTDNESTEAPPPLPEPEMTPKPDSTAIQCLFCKKMMKNERGMKLHLSIVHGARKKASRCVGNELAATATATAAAAE
jgi:hypothetical protein